MTIDEAIKFCHEKSENIKLKAEPQVFIDIAEWLELLKWYQQGMEDIPSESGVLPRDVYRAGYNKAVDEFAEKITEAYSYIPKYFVFELAQQLKAGDSDGSQRTNT